MTNKLSQARVPYQYTFPGLVAFYEGMDDDGLIATFHAVDAQRMKLVDTLSKKRPPKAQAEWVVEHITSCERRLTTIQQIINARRAANRG